MTDSDKQLKKRCKRKIKINTKKGRGPHLVTVNPLPNNMSIRRKTKKLRENSNFPGDKQKMRQKQKTKGNWTVVSESLISVWRDKNQVTMYFTRTHMQNHAQCCPCPSKPEIMPLQQHPHQSPSSPNHLFYAGAEAASVSGCCRNSPSIFRLLLPTPSRAYRPQ